LKIKRNIFSSLGFKFRQISDWIAWRIWVKLFAGINPLYGFIGKRQRADEPQKILVLHDMRVGDTIVITPLFRAMAGRFPGSIIDVVTSKIGSEVLKQNPRLNKIRIFDKSLTFREYRDLVFDLCREQYDLSIDLNNGYAGLNREFVPLLTGARQRIHFKRKGYRAALPTDEVEYPYLHAVDVFLSPLAMLGVDLKTVSRRYELFITAKENEWAVKTIDDLGLKPPVVLLNPTTLYVNKQWPAERFAWVADRLVKQKNASIIVAAAPEERPLADAVASLMKERCVSLAGRTTLRQYLALIAASDLVLSVDTAAVHAAQAFGVPVVAIFNPVAYSWQPLPGSRAVVLVKSGLCNKCWQLTPGSPAVWSMKCDKTKRECMEAISAEEVFEAASEEVAEEA